MTFQPSLRGIYVDALRNDILSKADLDASDPERAFIDVVLDYLGYDDDQEFRASCISDGKGDFGIDAWFVSDEGATFFQFKAVEEPETIGDGRKATPGNLSDLRRIFALIKSPDAPPQDANQRVRLCLQKFRTALNRRSIDEHKADAPYRVVVNFVSLSDAFTSQAKAEFDNICADATFSINGVPVEVQYRALMIDDLIAERWRERNADWRDSEGRKRDDIEFTVMGSIIEEPKSLVFFARAFDLVKMFEDFGYQIFEPNVRCEIKKSKVNEAIRNSILSHRGRREFRHLNNGITVIAASFQKIGKPIERIRIRQPGVINGLQTIKSIYDAYADLDAKAQAHFLEECSVLVRLHTREAVSEYRSLVKSTNNQNPMQQRNLRANDPEQLAFERLFAEFNWFYERKEGAWSAFKSDAKLWGTLRGKKPSDFMHEKIIKAIDNESLGQTWLSFLGFANEAVHERARIFSESNVYDLVFLRRTRKHGCEHGFKLDLERVLSESTEQAPDPRLMLVSYLSREFARQVMPAPKELRDEAITRLGLGSSLREKQNDKLHDDTRYVEGLIKRALSYVFPEFVGYCVFKAMGEGAHTCGAKILANGSFRSLSNNPDFKAYREEMNASSWTPPKDDLLAVMWLLFSECVAKLVSSSWRQQWTLAPNRTRFNYRPSTRELLFKELDMLDDYVASVELTRKWAIGLNKSKGIYKFVRQAIS